MREDVIRSHTIGACDTSSHLILRASLGDTILTVLDVFLPTLAKGVIIRRPAVMSLAERLDIDGRAVRRMQRLRAKYGSEPLRLRILGRSVALLFAPEDVHRVLAGTPEPFATETREKTAALAHFEPKSSLISRGPERADRRRFNEELLETHRPIHHLAESFAEIVASEVDLLDGIRERAELRWNEFAAAWFRIVRQIIFGKGARDDHELSEIMSRLRHAANWAFLVPQRPQLRKRLHRRIEEYLRRAEPASLAGAASHLRTTSITAPEQQVPQWLFAFDAAGMATFRTLALLASHPQEMYRAQREVTESRSGHLFPYLRSAVLDVIRLWPTSPLILRETSADTRWKSGIMPAGTVVVIFAPFFHRDDETLPYAHRFATELWNNRDSPQRGALIPFSDGSAACPGRELVLLVSTAVLAEMLRKSEVKLRRPARLLDEAKPLPLTLNHFGLRFDLNPA